jgi:hypothetical protein
MLTPERLLRLMIEVIFILLGILVIWLGVERRIYVDRHSIPWLILSVVLILWGLRALPRRGQWWARWENWTRGISLALLGVLMLVISRAPFSWVGPMLAAGGGVLAVRGFVGSILILWPRLAALRAEVR